MTRLICNFIDDPENSILVINCDLNGLGIIDVSKPITGHLSEDDERTLFEGHPISDGIKLTWNSTHHSDLLIKLIDCKIEKGLIFSRIPPSKDDSWDFEITNIIK